ASSTTLRSESITISDETKNDWWQEQILCIIKTHGLPHHIFINSNSKKNGDSKNKVEQIAVKGKRSDALVTWILASLSQGNEDIQVHGSKEQGKETQVQVFTKEHMDLRKGRRG
ncbi:hypothetical protein M8C21_009120, partial [Ambrosia artemisiifolia]